MIEVDGKRLTGKVYSPDADFNASEWEIDLDAMSMTYNKGSVGWHLVYVDGVVYSKCYNSSGDTYTACRRGLQVMFKEVIDKSVEELILSDDEE